MVLPAILLHCRGLQDLALLVSHPAQLLSPALIRCRKVSGKVEQGDKIPQDLIEHNLRLRPTLSEI